MKVRVLFPVFYVIILAAFGCQRRTDDNESLTDEQKMEKEGTFGYDLNFLKKYEEVVVLSSPDDDKAQAIIIPGYQGRVMTTTTDGDDGYSYGWVNYDLINKGVFQPHMNAFGGEERIWLSPEGGQFSVYFKKGAQFDFKNWQTPALIDTDTYEVVGKDRSSIHFKASAELENQSGALLNIEIDRKISMLSKADILNALKVSNLGNCKSVAYQTINTITNKGADWKMETGTLGIWLLGMFRPSEETVIIAPFSRENSKELLLTDDYFGKISGDRLVVKDSVVYMKADGKSRGKIGLSPKSAKNVAGSYDRQKGVLTIVQYSLNPDGDYLKSTWELHKEPFSGDVLNAYNDGKLADGTQMGPFYELESNSETRALKQNEHLSHSQITYHFEGEPESLNTISKEILGCDLRSTSTIFE